MTKVELSCEFVNCHHLLFGITFKSFIITCLYGSNIIYKFENYFSG